MMKCPKCKKQMTTEDVLEDLGVYQNANVCQDCKVFIPIPVPEWKPPLIPEPNFVRDFEMIEGD